MPGFLTESVVVDAATFQPVIDALQTQISAANVTAVLAVAVGACVGLVFMWWGIRKVSSMLMWAFKRGRIVV